MVLNPGKCDLILFGLKEHGQFYLICSDITLKHSSHEKVLGITIYNKLFFDEQINNISTTAVKKLDVLNRIKQYMKEKNSKGIITTPFIIYHFSYGPLIWMFCPKKSTKKLNVFIEDL